MRGSEARLVLGGGHGDPEWAVAIARGERRADDREIVGFRAARRKHDLIRLGADGFGDRALRFLDTGARGAPESVR